MHAYQGYITYTCTHREMHVPPTMSATAYLSRNRWGWATLSRRYREKTYRIYHPDKTRIHHYFERVNFFMRLSLSLSFSARVVREWRYRLFDLFPRISITPRTRKCRARYCASRDATMNTDDDQDACLESTDVSSHFLFVLLIADAIRSRSGRNYQLGWFVSALTDRFGFLRNAKQQYCFNFFKKSNLLSLKRKLEFEEEVQCVHAIYNCTNKCLFVRVHV